MELLHERIGVQLFLIVIVNSEQIKIDKKLGNS